MSKYQLTFRFVDTEEEARVFCANVNAMCRRYMREKHPAHYTPGVSEGGKERKFICWYRF